jgi:hypothetical protein
MPVGPEDCAAHLQHQLIKLKLSSVRFLQADMQARLKHELQQAMSAAGSSSRPIESCVTSYAKVIAGSHNPQARSCPPSNKYVSLLPSLIGQLNQVGGVLCMPLLLDKAGC